MCFVNITAGVSERARWRFECVRARCHEHLFFPTHLELWAVVSGWHDMQLGLCNCFGVTNGLATHNHIQFYQIKFPIALISPGELRCSVLISSPKVSSVESHNNMTFHPFTTPII